MLESIDRLEWKRGNKITQINSFVFFFKLYFHGLLPLVFIWSILICFAFVIGFIRMLCDFYQI